MKIAGLPPNSNNYVAESKLKLLAASNLPAAAANTPKASHALAEKKSLSNLSVELSDDTLAQLSKLKARDIQVRQHEQVHVSASGELNVSGASFTYQRGPNGVNYAVGGDVKIDTSPGHTPEETLSRAEKIIDAALAPVDPSPVDRSVAAKAQNMAQQARLDIQQQESSPNARPADRQSIVSQAYDSNNAVKAKIDTFV